MEVRSANCTVNSIGRSFGWDSMASIVYPIYVGIANILWGKLRLESSGPEPVSKQTLVSQERQGGLQAVLAHGGLQVGAEHIGVGVDVRPQPLLMGDVAAKPGVI